MKPLRRKRSLVTVLLVLLAWLGIAACHHGPASLPAAIATTRTTASSAPAKASAPASATPARAPAGCEQKSSRTKPSASGETTVVGANGKPHALHWARLNAPSQPARGTLFYLAGGPLSHMMYVDLAAAFQRVSYPDLDVVLYDYFGFNCSTALQQPRALGAEVANLTMPGMAQDFIALKRSMLGRDGKAFLMGGSHGAMLGAEIVRDYPDEIAKAVLFSGDTESGWLEEGWVRFDRLMTKLDATHPGFAAELAKLLESAAAGEVAVERNGAQVTVSRPTLEVALWMSFALDSSAQAELPALVKSGLAGERTWLANVYGAALGLQEPIARAAAPTEASAVTTFHRCDVWFPPSRRAQFRAAVQPATRFFRRESFVDYWSALCKEYDALGEHLPVSHVPTPTAVPVLGWVGDQDTFDPEATRARWSALTTKLSFQTMEGWSHDFGPSPTAGFLRAAGLVKKFYAE